MSQPNYTTDGKNLFPAPDAAAQSPAAMLRQYGGVCTHDGTCRRVFPSPAQTHHAILVIINHR